MYEELFYVCLTTDNGELDLISSHATYAEAYAELKTLSQPHPSNRYSVMCLGNLLHAVEYFESKIVQSEKQIANKQLKRQAFRDAREILREIRGDLSSEAHNAITEKIIDLTDMIDKGERYVENRLRDIEWCKECITERLDEIELLKAAFESVKAANERAIEILEKRSLIHEMKQSSDRGSKNEETPDLLQMGVHTN